MQIAPRISSSALFRPTTPISKPSSLGFERPSLVSRGCSKGSVGMHQEWDELVVPMTWTVKREDLEMVPEDFPLERTHRLIEGIEAPVVATRISDVLRNHSVEAAYKSKPPKAKCKTRDFVSFRIRLYAGSENGDPVVVEVQRRSGPASCFMRVCRAILDAAEGKDNSASSVPPPFENKPVRDMKCLQGVKTDYNETEISQSALEDATSMLRSQKRDANLLGLESLCCLTDPFKTNPVICLSISKAIALGSGGDDIREEIMALIERDVFNTDIIDEAGLANNSELLRQCALTIFANSLSLCAKDGCLATSFGEQLWFRECLFPTLLDEIKRVESNACNATRAAVCVHSLAFGSRAAKSFMIGQGIEESLRTANKYGTVCNDLLAHETERCLKILQQ